MPESNRRDEVVICEYPGCTRVGRPCYLLDDEYDHPSHHYCSEHAFAEGFCYGCGLFYSGVEAFDFGPGLCETCWAEEEAGDDEEDDWTGTDVLSFVPGELEWEWED